MSLNQFSWCKLPRSNQNRASNNDPTVFLLMVSSNFSAIKLFIWTLPGVFENNGAILNEDWFYRTFSQNSPDHGNENTVLIIIICYQPVDKLFLFHIGTFRWNWFRDRQIMLGWIGIGKIGTLTSSDKCNLWWRYLALPWTPHNLRLQGDTFSSGFTKVRNQYKTRLYQTS